MALALIALGAGALLVLPARGGQRRAPAAPPENAARAPAGLAGVLPTDARAAREAARLPALARAKKWDEWLRLYRRLTADRTLLIPRGPDLFAGLRGHCHDLFETLPAEAQQRYRQVVAEEAGRAFEAAARYGDPAAMAEVLGRYRHAAAGRRALRWLGDRALDRGQCEPARLAYARLAALPGASAVELLRYSMAAQGAGRAAEARGALARLRREFGAGTLRLGGQEVTGAGAAARLEEWFAAGAGAAPAAGFAAPDGTRGREALPAGSLQVRWQYRFPTEPAGEPWRSGRSLFILRRGGFGFLTFPAADGDRVYVQGPRGLAALDAATGRPAWEREGFELPPDTPVYVPTSRRERDTGPFWYPNSRPFQAAPSLDGALLAARVPLVPREYEDDVWPGKPGLGVYRVRDGTPLWQAAPSESPFDTYFNAPVLAGGVVVSGSARLAGGMTEHEAVALEAATGQPLWKTYLGGGGHCTGAADGSPPLVRNGVVWIETTLHTLACLDLLTGDVRLVYRAGIAPEEAATGRSAPFVTNRAMTLVAAGGGRVLFAPRWGTQVVALDPAAGKVAWRGARLAERGRGQPALLFAADARRAYLHGEGLQAVSLADGKRAWSWTPRSGGAGYPALAGDRIYVPVGGRIQVLAAEDGRPLQLLATGAALGRAAEFPTLTAAGGRLFAATEDRLVAFGVD